MTSSVKNGHQPVEFEMGDRVRVRKRVEDNVKTPISRKAVGIVGDVHKTFSGKTLITVVFEKQHEAPSFWPEELVKLPPRKPKAEATDVLAAPPKMPDDLKG